MSRRISSPTTAVASRAGGGVAVSAGLRQDPSATPKNSAIARTRRRRARQRLGRTRRGREHERPGWLLLRPV